MKVFAFVYLSLVCFFGVAQVPQLDHVVIVIFENKDYSQIIGSANAPYINGLATAPYGALFTQSHAIQNPSQPNYLHIFSGSDQGVTTNDVPTGIPFTTPNLGASLLANGFTFIGYAEDLPYSGYTGATSGAYARKHCPWINWQDSGTNGIPAALSQPFSSFPTDYSTLPTVSFVTPNLSNDMHDPTTDKPLAIANGDTWLKNNLDGYVQWAKTHNSLLIITFDEDDFTDLHIATLFVGEKVQQGQYSESINHHNILRTLEDMYGLPYAGNSANVDAITDVWITSPMPIELLTFEAEKEDDYIELTWQTSSEINNDYFTVERAQDGKTFYPIGSVKGAGTTAVRHDYHFTDKDLSAQRLFYRLKQTDFDGRYTYSKVIPVTMDAQSEQKADATIFPNPSEGTFSVMLNNFDEDDVYLKLFSSTGLTVYEQHICGSRDKNDSYLIRLPDSVSAGIYTLFISNDQTALFKKLIVH